MTQQCGKRSALAMWTLFACGWLLACSGVGAGQGFADASVDGAVEDASPDRNTPATDGGVDAADASTCGVVEPGTYLLHFSNAVGTNGCTAQADVMSTITTLDANLASNCTLTRDPSACTLTIACHDVNGRFITDDKTVYKLPGPGVLTNFESHFSNNGIDTLGTYPATSCAFDTTYTKK